MSASCPQCQASVPVGAGEGLCPRCLLLGGLEWRGAPPPEDDAPPEVLPRRFGEYELEERLAEGGMGVVYRARHLTLGRTVALKMIRAAHIAGAEELRRFRQEARAAAQLEHPHVVPVYEIGEHGGVHFFTMKLAAGGCLQLTAPQPPEAAAALTAKIARAVHYAHQHGVLHRDVKPSNILMEASGEPMVGDFGLAHFAQGGPDITLSGTVVGTPAYMAPEQARGVCTTASDVYSLGALLYALLAGHAPFSGRSHFEIMRRVVEDEPRALSLLRRARDVEAICFKCLRKEPSARYASAADLADDLERWLRGEPVLARAVSRRERLVKWARRRPALAALLAVSTLGAAAFITFNIVSERRLRHERNYAQQQEGMARNSATLAENSERAARLQLYAADVFLADSALAGGDYGLARAALEAHRPHAGVPDLRGFEWYCLRRLCEGDKAVALHGHTDAVNAVAFSPDGARLISGGRDGQVLVHDLTKHGIVLSIPSARDRTQDFTEHHQLTPVFLRSPEASRRLLTTFGENYNVLFQRMRPSAPGDIRSVAIAPDGSIATGSQWSWVRVWDGTSAELIWVSPAFDCRSIAFADEGRKLITGDIGRDGEQPARVRIFDSVTHEETLKIADSTGVFALSADGRTLAVPMRDSRMELRDPATGAVRTSWDAGTRLKGVAISANGQRLGGLGDDPREAFLWTADGQRTGPLSVDGAILRAVALTGDGTLMATAGVDHAVHLWQAATGVLQRTLRGHTDEVLAVAFSPDGKHLATGCRDQTVRLYDLVKLGRRDRGVPADTPVLITGSHVIENSKDGSVRVGALTAAERTALPAGKSRTVLCADGGGFITWTRAQLEIESWNLDGQPLHPAVMLESSTAPPRVVAASARNGLIAAADGSKSLSFHGLADGRRRHPATLPWSTSRLFFSPDGALLLSFAWPHFCAVVRSATGEILCQWQVPGAEVGTFTFSPDGTLVALGGTDNLVSIHDTATGRRLTMLRGHKADIKGAAFSPDGRTLATSSDSRTLKLWHVPTWRELATLSRDGVFPFLHFSPDNDCLHAWDYGKNLHRFTAPRE